MPQMVIANRLADGIVVFLAPGDEWAPWIGDGRVLESGEEAERGLAVAQRHEAENIVVDSSLIEVTLDEEGPRPTAIRDAIRAFGPTVGSPREKKGPQGFAGERSAARERA